MKNKFCPVNAVEACRAWKGIQDDRIDTRRWEGLDVCFFGFEIRCLGRIGTFPLPTFSFTFV